jgi:hypothetical protein
MKDGIVLSGMSGVVGERQGERAAGLGVSVTGM